MSDEETLPSPPLPYFLPLPSHPSPSFAGTTLLLPQPSLASLPQLATDLLVHTLGLKVVGYLGLRDYIPTVGGLDRISSSPISSSGYCMGVEVYMNETITLVLPRSPIIKSRKPHHLIALREWVEGSGFGEVLVITGVDAGARGDEALLSNTPLSHYIPITHPSTPMSCKLSLSTPSYTSPNHTSIPLFPQGGLTRGILETFSTSNVGVATICIYASEGDNSQSAYFLASALSEILSLPIGKDEEGKKVWKEPVSWKTGLLGSELGRERVGEMYG